MLSHDAVVRHLSSLRVEHIQRLVRPLVQKLMIHPRNANIFNKPVDPLALGLSDYFTKVKRPMDLGTVRSKLQKGSYKDVQSCVADIVQVFQNAMTYNQPNHNVHQVAKVLRTDFEADLRSLEEKVNRDVDRKAAHACTSCCGNTCHLCGERCLKFEPPTLICYGTCQQRIKRNNLYYLTLDGP